MDLSEALNEIESSDLDQRASIVAAIRKHVNRIISQKSNASSRLTELLAELGIEDGETEDRLTQAKAKVRELNKQLVEFEKTSGNVEGDKQKLQEQLDQATAKLAKLERSNTLRSVAQKYKLNSETFTRLADLHSLELQEESGEYKVKSGDQLLSISDYISKDPEWKPFASVLMAEAEPAEQPSQSDGEQEARGRKPTGGTGGSGDKKQSVVKQVISTRYYIPGKKPDSATK